MASRFETYKQQYRRLWETADILPKWRPTLISWAEKILKHKDVYQAVTAKTGVPWWFVGLLHMRESGCDFQKHLHNGDPLTARTVHVPAGRPAQGSPPFTWEESAIDALKQKSYHKFKTWTLEEVAYRFEQFNGFGYRRARRPNSPYLWSGTDEYAGGKFKSDGVYDANLVDKQPGTMAVLKILIDLDASVSFTEYKTISEAMKETPASRAKVNGVLALVAALFASMWDWVLSAASSVGQLVGLLPGLADNVTSAVGAGQTIAVQTGVPWPAKAAIAIALVCIVSALVAELNARRVKE